MFFVSNIFMWWNKQSRRKKKLLWSGNKNVFAIKKWFFGVKVIYITINTSQKIHYLLLLYRNRIDVTKNWYNCGSYLSPANAFFVWMTNNLQNLDVTKIGLTSWMSSEFFGGKKKELRQKKLVEEKKVSQNARRKIGRGLYSIWFS